MNYPVPSDRLDIFLAEVRKIKPLTKQEEYDLAVKYKETGDVDAAHRMVVSHLPFVVKIAFQYRHYMIPVQDLIQEGSIGMMKAIKRFDPYLGYRLSSFAIWWIKAYIKNFILKSWNLVKLGTTQAQRKLFFRIGDIGEHLDAESKERRVKDLAKELKVKHDEVIEMEARVKAREWSLNETVGEDKDLTGMDMLEDDSANQEQMLLEAEREAALSGLTKKALRKLDPRERFIVGKRFFEDSPWTLQKLGDHFGTSRERIRQLEKRAVGKLRKELAPQAAEELLPT
ncbi:RNA polymerase factor sigma-32 [Thermodesulfobacteriota bacterium]